MALIVDTAPVPPSVAGIQQPVFGSGSATVPPTPIVTTGSFPFPPPELGSGTPPFPPGIWTPPPLPSFSVPAVVDLPGGPPLSWPGPSFQTGSATSPTAASWIPQFTTSSPTPPVTFANIFINFGTPPVPIIMTSQNVDLDDWGLFAGPNPPDGWVGFSADVLHSGSSGFAERRAGSVLQSDDTDQVHQPQQAQNSGNKPMSKARSKRNSDRP